MRLIAATVVLLALAAGDALAAVRGSQGPDHTHAQPARTSELGVRDDCLRCLLDAYGRVPKKDPRREQLLRQMEHLMLRGSSPLDPLARVDDTPAVIDIQTVWPGWTIQDIPTDTSADIVLCGTLYMPGVLSPGVVVRLGPISIRAVDQSRRLNDPESGPPPN